MRGIVWRALALVAAAVGLAAAFVVPLRAAGSAPLPGPTVQMPPARLQTTVSVFPAPGRPESAPGPVLRPHVPKERASAWIAACRACDDRERWASR